MQAKAYISMRFIKVRLKRQKIAKKIQQGALSQDVKVKLYALFNELLWYKTLEKIDFRYLKYRSRRLMKMIKN